jgi:adenosylmethionine-8-amino-7-oxononanoate aminotransferase
MSSPTTLDTSATAIVEADRQHVIHGFAHLERNGDPGPIFRSARGIHMTDIEGNVWLDACGGLANISLGYGRDDLADVAAEALRQLSFGTTFYHTRGHIPGAQLAMKLAEITPEGLDQFFYALGGSDAVETAIKFARYVNAVNGRPEKHHIIGRLRSYHGVTYGGLSLTGDPAMWNNCGPLLPGFSHIDQPASDSVGAAQALEDEILRVGPDKVAAFMAEPISTPNGIKVPPADYWPQVREICDRYDVLMISDEVLTGFGRAGKMFAIENWGVSPDIMTLSKAITAGYFPLSVVAITSPLLDRLSAGPDIFRHGVTSGGHAAGCAVALATIEIMEREGVIEHSIQSGEYLVGELRALGERQRSLLPDTVRGIGMMAAIDFDTATMGAEFGAAVHKRFIQERLFVRDYLASQTVGFLPSLTCTTHDIDEIIQRMEAAIVATEAEHC